MQIITLTSDQGLKDYYVAAIKGRIFSLIQNAVVVDVTHDIKPFDNAEAAYQLKSCIHEFPEGTIHLVGVDSEPYLPTLKNNPFMDTNWSYPLVLCYKKQFVICNDNGFAGAFLGEDHLDGLYRYKQIEQESEKWIFMLKDCFVDLANRISKNIPLETFLEPIDYFKKSLAQTAIMDNNMIQGAVIHIDAFGNLITNITKKDFYEIGGTGPFVITYQKKINDIDAISEAYNEVALGKNVAIFNHNGLLEIAINRGANGGNGGADRLFGLRVGSVVRVTFFPAGSLDTFGSLLL